MFTIFCCRVCRRWNLLSRSTVLWKNVEVELNDYSDQTAIAQSFVNTLPPCVACLQLNFCNRDYWYQSLYFEELSMNLNKRCPHLEMLILKDAELSGSLLSVIDLCTQLLQKVQKLVFYHCSFEYSQIGEGSGTPQIKVLDVSRCLVKNFYNLTFSRMPHLKELRLFGTKVKDYWFEDDSFFNQLHVLDMGETTISPRTLQAIQNHGFNLKKLFLCFTDFRDGYLDFNNSAFPHLKTICLKRCRVTLEGIVSLIKSCQSLENVYVDPDMAQSYAAHPFVIANACKLGIVKFVECVNHRKVGYLCE